MSRTNTALCKRTWYDDFHSFPRIWIYAIAFTNIKNARITVET